MTQRDKRAYLFDILTAAGDVCSFVGGKSIDDYRAELLLRRAVEREFIIISEALRQIQRRWPELEELIKETRHVADFGMHLVHGYYRIDDGLVWCTIEDDLAHIIVEVQELLVSLGEPPASGESS